MKWAYLAKGNIESVRTLLAHGVDIDWTNDCNKSALHFAVRYADNEIIDFLINHKISVRIVNRYNGMPLLSACSTKSNIKNVRTLLENGADINWTII